MGSEWCMGGERGQGEWVARRWSGRWREPGMTTTSVWCVCCLGGVGFLCVSVLRGDASGQELGKGAVTERDSLECGV